jgi:hypothetical protein
MRGSFHELISVPSSSSTSIRDLDPSVDPDSIPNKRTIKHIRLFKKGELGCHIPGARKAERKPLGRAEIVSALVNIGGFDPRLVAHDLEPRA